MTTFKQPPGLAKPEEAQTFGGMPCNMAQPQNDPRSEVLIMRATPQLRAQVLGMARAHGLTITGYMEIALSDHQKMVASGATVAHLLYCQKVESLLVPFLEQTALDPMILHGKEHRFANTFELLVFLLRIIKPAQKKHDD